MTGKQTAGDVEDYDLVAGLMSHPVDSLVVVPETWVLPHSIWTRRVYMASLALAHNHHNDINRHGECSKERHTLWASPLCSLVQKKSQDGWGSWLSRC
ncbi:hypothetical protein CC79DRAFT_1328039 [Sarocladium strictum]